MPKRRQRRDQDGIYERSDSPYYWASYIDAGGRRARRSTGIRKSVQGRREAEALLAKWRLEAHRGRHWDEQPERSWEELMVPYLQAHAHKRSAERDRAIVRLQRPHFEGRALGGLGAADVRGYVDRRRAAGAAPATINRELALLSAAINYARREWQWDIPNPVSGRKLREPEGRVRWISRAEAAALVEAARSEPRSPWLADFITLGLNTGMRKGEILGLEWRRVDLQAGLIHLEAAHTKANKRRSVPLNKAARGAILARARWRAEYAPASPWVFCEKDGRRVQNVRRSFGTACRRAGIGDFHPHDLRHTCAAWLVSAGVPLPEVRDLLGHSTVRMTERYAHLAPENVRAAVAVLDAASHDRVTPGQKKGAVPCTSA